MPLRIFSPLLFVAALSACTSEAAVVGASYPEGGLDLASEAEHLIAASAAIAGEWKTTLPLGDGFPNATIRFTPRPGSPSGDYRVISCPGDCRIHVPADAGFVPDFIFKKGEYSLVKASKTGQVRGALFSEDFALGIHFDFEAIDSPQPEELYVEVLPGFSWPLERVENDSARR